MLSLLLGFASSIVPSIVNLFKDSSDKKQELALTELQLQYADKIGQHTVDAAQAAAQGALETARVNADNAIQTATVEADAEIVSKADIGVIDVNAMIRPLLCVVTMGVFVYACIWSKDLLQVAVVTDSLGFVWGYYFGKRCFDKRGL